MGREPWGNDWMTRILDMLEAHFGDEVEFVLHDLSKDYDHTIVDIRNGGITGRKAGDSGDNLGLEVIRGTEKDGNRFNYINFTDDGRVLRSSTLFLRDGEGRAVLAIGINEDITRMAEFENYLRQRNQLHSRARSTIIRDVGKLLDALIQEAQLETGKTYAAMSKEDKQAFVAYLDRRGAFLITRSGPRICELLGISKFTLYNYLELARGGPKRRDDPPENDGDGL